MLPDYSAAYEGYRNLYILGQSAIEPLKKKVLDVDWSKSGYKEVSRYVSGLFALIHDIDEDEAKEILGEMISTGCPKHIQAQMKSICNFSHDHYWKYKVCDIDIFEHKEITKNCDIRSHIQNWLRKVPPKDVLDISRLYIIRKDDSANAAGTYTPILFNIMVVWDNPYKEGSIFFKMFSIFTEKTFYHEIGHHVHRNDFPDLPDREREADRYAYSILKLNHPYLRFLSRVLSKLGMRSEKNYYRWGL